MNVMKLISLDVEERMSLLRPTDHDALRAWSAGDEDLLYSRCFSEVIADEEGRIWAEGNIRSGDHILLVNRFVFSA